MSSKIKSEYDIGQDIWERKYRFRGRDNIAADKTIEDSWKRIAKAVAGNEQKHNYWQDKFLEILHDFRFLPGGRIIANAGTCRSQVTMFNCYVMNRIEDSINGIFDTVKDAALTQKQGGGVGFDFSTLRPAGSHISGCEAESSGPLSFMQVLDATCRTIMSAGQRRGAQMGVMRCDHPDIEKFVSAKRNNQSLQMFNLSVAVTEKFISAVRDNREWELVFNGQVYKTIHAVDLWEQIMKSTYNFAEPGFLLIDRINEMNNLAYCENITATNPCGEQPLPPYGACLLGSLNLTRFVSSPFSGKSDIKLDEIAATTRIAVRFLDNVIDISGYPLPAQEQEAAAKRRMGIGITGLADMLIMLGQRYGSPESLNTASRIMEIIRDAAYAASSEIAAEKGRFPLFDAAKYLRGKFVSELPADIRKDIRKYGIRNSHLTSIAPTGTISLFAGNVSSGLEPVFAYHYTRRIRNGHEDDFTEVEISDFAYREYLKLSRKKKVKDSDLPDYFVSSGQISPEEHVEMQAALQPFVDSSISKTINVPPDFPYEDFKNIYLYAHDRGLKGCTTFRPSEHITGVLSQDSKPKKKVDDSTMVELTERPRELEGTTYKLRTPLSPEALYLTINDVIEEDGHRRPYELFINTKNLQHFSWIVAMTRLISAVFRRERDPSFLVEELKSIYDPNGGYFSGGRYIPSLAADIGFTIEKHLRKIGIIESLENEDTAGKNREKTAPVDSSQLLICPKCNQKGLLSIENCLKCILCDYSKCG